MDGREMDKIGKQRQVMWLQKISTVMIYIFFFFTTMLSIQETDNLLIWQIHSFEVFRNMKPKPLIIVLIQISTNKSIDPRAGISSQLTNMVTFRVRCFMFLFAFKRNLIESCINIHSASHSDMFTIKPPWVPMIKAACHTEACGYL